MFSKFIENRKFIIILVLIILIIVGFFGVGWYKQKMFLIEQGRARSSFPFKEYSLLELARQGQATDESIILERLVRDLPTKITPKDTLDAYIQALEDYDIEKAINCFVEGQAEQKRFREFLSKAKNKKLIIDNVARISREIREKIKLSIGSIESGNKTLLSTSYKYLCKARDNSCFISFEKDFYGNWKISKLY